MGVRTKDVQPGDLGDTLQRLGRTIQERHDCSPEDSYTAKLLQGDEDYLLQKVGEEAIELILAVKEKDHEHIRYEAADLLYHMLVVLDRVGVSQAELAGELDARMK